MNSHLKIISDLLQNTDSLTAKEKEMMRKALLRADKDLTITEFKLERTEKVKRTTTILLEETISELEQKRKVVEESKSALEKSLIELKSAQEQLIQQEKLASLGQLTAGIAHEIKNPLNFVNNFSEVSLELVEEAREEVKSEKAKGKSEKEEPPLLEVEVNITLILEILDDIEANLRKIHEHGSRADSIVKSMLQHSRGGSGKMELVNLNSLIKEYVNLSFHGMRAGKDPINVEIDLQLEESTGMVPLIAGDFSRVILNLCNNAFDGMKEKLTADSRQLSDNRDQVYKPILTVRTLKKDNTVTIEIEDNGPGIPDEIKEKIMQPFFTTRKGTQGTGLGLSITNDIVRAHRGELKVESTPGKGSVFTVHLNASG